MNRRAYHFREIPSRLKNHSKFARMSRQKAAQSSDAYLQSATPRN